MSETQLVESAIGGDIESFGLLCEKYYTSMTAVAYSALGDHHMAEDAAQETFARALTNLKKLKSKEKFGFWLARICRNVAKDMIRKNIRNNNAENFSRSTQSSNNDRENQMVRQVIRELAIAEKELIVLRYYDNLSHDQISSVLGLSKAAINNRLVRARKKIAKHLKNNGSVEVES